MLHPCDAEWRLRVQIGVERYAKKEIDS
jgi:hypothetical protein